MSFLPMPWDKRAYDFLSYCETKAKKDVVFIDETKEDYFPIAEDFSPPYFYIEPETKAKVVDKRKATKKQELSTLASISYSRKRKKRLEVTSSK
jgi:hypothetical protein